MRSGIPTELLAYRQWVVWRNETVGGRNTKVPYDPKTGRRAESNNPMTWATCMDAERNSRRLKADGLGFVFTATDPFCGIDIDNCFENGHLKPQAAEIVQRLNSFTEFSPSGSGLHVLVRASVPAGRHPAGLGIFDRGRYFTITGRHLEGSPTTIQERQDVVDWLYRTLTPANAAERVSALPGTAVSDDDDELLTRAMRNPKFQALFGGDLTSCRGDHSAADMALCTMLAYWTGRSADRIDSLFRRSKLMREKWDRRWRDSTYGRRTIEKAIS